MSTTEESLPGQAAEAATWHKTLTWWDGFVLMLPLASGVFVSSGFMVGALGAWGAFLVMMVMCVVALLSNFLFGEMAAMFPEKTGGLSMYTREAMRRYFIPAGVLAAFGYWLGYAISISFCALQVGQLIQVQWFPKVTWSVTMIGGTHLGLANFIGFALVIVAAILAWLGVKIMARAAFWLGILAVAVVLIAMIGPWVTGQAHTSNLTMHLGNWRGVVVWMYIAGWTLFGSELGAAFAPEYKDAKRDVPRVLLLSAIYGMIIFTITPVSVCAMYGEKFTAMNALTLGPMAAAKVVGGGQWLFTIIYAAAISVSVLIFTQDSARATAGMAEDGDTIKQFRNLNRFGVPHWGVLLVGLSNLAFLAFVANPVAIILASNLGYILCHSLANWSFVVLRVTQPDRPRPIKMGPAWMPIAVLLGCFHLFILTVGILSPGAAGYGGLKDTLIGIGFLCFGLVLWVIRVVVQEHQPLRLREPVAAVAVAS